MRCNLPAENANFETLWSRAALFSPDIKLRLKVNTCLSAGLILGARGPHAGQPGGTFAPGTRCCGAAPRRGTRLGNGRAAPGDALGRRTWGAPATAVPVPTRQEEEREPAPAEVEPAAPPPLYLLPFPQSHRCPARPAAAGATGSASRPRPLPPAT